LAEWIPLLQVIGPILGGAVLAIISYFLGIKKNRAEIAKLEGEKKSVEAAAGLSTAEAASIISRAAADIVQPLTNRIRELQQDSLARDQRHAEEIRGLQLHIGNLTEENVKLKTKVAHLEAKVALLSKPHELANETTKRLGESDV
jgi:phage shock protein A